MNDKEEKGEGGKEITIKKNGRPKGKETENKFIDITQASKLSGLHPHTLRKYADLGKIKSYKTPAGQRKFDRVELEKMCSPISFIEEVPQVARTNFLYARVSSKKQLDDLSRQIKYLQEKRPEYISYTALSDIASGINFKRKGLETILDSCIQGTIGELVIAHRDRLCRFGFDLINLFVTKSGGKITILDDEQNKSGEQELAEDLLSIIHIYSCKQMGRRSYKSKQETKIFESETETEFITEKSSGGVDEYI